MKRLVLLFNPSLWFLVFSFVSMILVSLIVVGGWDAGVPFTTVRYGKTITRTFHFRSFVLFFLLAAFHFIMSLCGSLLSYAYCCNPALLPEAAL